MTLNVRSLFLTSIALGIVLPASAHAQEIPRPSQSRVREEAPAFSRPYNLKLGPVAFAANAGIGIEFNDNVNYTKTNQESDLVLTPRLSLTGVWQVTKLNSLNLRTTLGYTKYLQHPELDSQSTIISPDSEIRLNLFVGDFKIVLHEKFSLQEDPVTDGGVSGVATLGRFTNVIGGSVLWDGNDLTLLLGYDHLNYISTGKAANTNGSANNNLSTLDHSNDQISLAAAVKLTPTTRTGLEGTAAISEYPNNPFNNYSTFTFGPYLDVQLTRYTRITFGVGYQWFVPESTEGPAVQPDIFATSNSASSQNQEQGGYYFNVAIDHRLNRAYQDRLAIGREVQIGLLTERTVTTFIRYSSQWAVTRQLGLTSSLYYENVHQLPQNGSLAGLVPDYRRFGATFSTSYQLTRKLVVSLSYQYTFKLSDAPEQDYVQNRFALQFGYQF